MTSSNMTHQVTCESMYVFVSFWAFQDKLQCELQIRSNSHKSRYIQDEISMSPKMASRWLQDASKCPLYASTIIARISTRAPKASTRVSRTE